MTEAPWSIGILGKKTELPHFLLANKSICILSRIQKRRVATFLMTSIKKTFCIILAITSVFLVGIHSLYAKVYRWKNGKGQKHYSFRHHTIYVKNMEVKQDGRWKKY